jgi:YafQ family addiction module toxin component
MRYEIKPSLKRIIDKLKKKSPEMFKAIYNKIEEIVNSKNPDRYKPLRAPMQNKKRVHIMKSFVLVFEYDKKNDVINFLDFDHHDNVYKKI